jgi:hypothetical protein
MYEQGRLPPAHTLISEGKLEGNPMSKTITLPSGNTVTLRDPSELRVKDRKKVLAAATGQEGLLQSMSMLDGLMSILIEKWSFDLIIPSIVLTSLDELTMPDYDAIAAEVTTAQDSLFPALNQTAETEANPDSPFVNSNA